MSKTNNNDKSQNQKSKPGDLGKRLAEQQKPPTTENPYFNSKERKQDEKN